MSNKVLIVVDMQNDFIYGPLGSEEARKIVPNVIEKIEEAVRLGRTVIFTRDTHSANYLNTQEGKNLPVPHCIRHTEGWEIIPELKKYIDYKWVVDKFSFGYDCWEEGALPLLPDGIELVGVCSDICVISNALILKALYFETEITVDASCCAGTTPENHRAALQVMKSCQINVIGE